MPAFGDRLSKAGRYRCLRCGDVAEWTEGDLVAGWCYACDDDDPRWELVEELVYISDPEGQVRMDIPDILGPGREDEAAALVRGYLETDPRRPGGVVFTGAMFDTWDGGGDRAEVVGRFTDADVSAVTFLSVQVPPRPLLDLLHRRRSIFEALLARIPHDVALEDAESHVVGPGSPADQLWEELTSLTGVGPVTAGKLIARKRPRLIPVYDSVVKEVVGAPPSFWAELRIALQVEDKALARRLRRVGDLAEGQHLSVLRVFDIVAWRLGMERRARPVLDPWSEPTG